MRHGRQQGKQQGRQQDAATANSDANRTYEHVTVPALGAMVRSGQSLHAEAPSPAENVPGRPVNDTAHRSKKHKARISEQGGWAWNARSEGQWFKGDRQGGAFEGHCGKHVARSNAHGLQVLAPNSPLYEPAWHALNVVAASALTNAPAHNDARTHQPHHEWPKHKKAVCSADMQGRESRRTSRGVFAAWRPEAGRERANGARRANTTPAQEQLR